MLTNIAEIDDQSMSAAEGAFPFRADAITERFRDQCLRRLDAEPARPPRTIHLDRRPGAEPADDPAISAIEEWLTARHAYLAHRREIKPLWNAVPEWVRNWQGVYAGRAERPDGEAVPVLARTEETLNECYDRRAREAPTADAAQRIERRRRRALAELRLTLAAEKGAWRAAGLPFDRDLEDDYWHGFRERIARAEAAVESTPARTARGIDARCRHAARLIDELGEDGADADLARHVRVMVLAIARDVADMVHD
jgi:hypothetical protein